jgi:dTDP-4-dehydrorhamnose reductase
MKFPNMVPLACDVRRSGEIDLAVRNTKVDVIVHLASISDVDVCERKENQEAVDQTNVHGTLNVAEVAERRNCEMVILSSVHVFDGKRGNYKEDSKPNPKNYYGFTKLAAEQFQEIFPFMKVVRTSYLFNHERVFKHLYPLRAGHSYAYPTFIERSFMYLPHFAEVFHTYLLNYSSMPSKLHISGCDTASWYKFMLSMATIYGVNNSLVDPRRDEIKMDVAPRPYKAGLNTKASEKLGLPQFNYYDGLQEMKETSR